MGLTYDVKIFEEKNPNEAYSFIADNAIYMGKNVFTLETLIHEINEIEISRLMREIENIKWDEIKILKDMCGNIKIAKFKDLKEFYKDTDSNETCIRGWVSHLISPYGTDSLISPCLTKYGDMAKNEDYLLVNSRIQ